MVKLKTYRAKRKFSGTPEPRGKIKKSSGDRIFVVQKHDASHLHYDFRFEHNGVLKSWAVPKGIPKKFGEKRLAIATEDHPMEYAKFAGTIPEGHYGAGTVKIWDSGTCDVLKMKPGQIELRLYGKKLKGAYALIKTKIGWLFVRFKPQ